MGKASRDILISGSGSVVEACGGSAGFAAFAPISLVGAGTGGVNNAVFSAFFAGIASGIEIVAFLGAGLGLGDGLEFCNGLAFCNGLGFCVGMGFGNEIGLGTGMETWGVGRTGVFSTGAATACFGCSVTGGSG